MARQMATPEANTNSESFTVEVMPRTVAMAPGPNMIGMARGTKATSSSLSPEPLAMPNDAPEDEGENRVKPMRIRMMPPTIRTMLSGTTKTHSIRCQITKKEKKKCQEQGVEA